MVSRANLCSIRISVLEDTLVDSSSGLLISIII